MLWYFFLLVLLWFINAKFSFRNLLPGTDLRGQERSQKGGLSPLSPAPPPPPPINNTPSWRGRRDEPRGHQSGHGRPDNQKGLWHDLSWRLHQTCFGRVVGVWGRRESIAFFMLRHYTACNPPFLLKSVEFLSQPARLQTTTLRYNKGLGRRDEKRRSLILHAKYFQRNLKER